MDLFMQLPPLWFPEPHITIFSEMLDFQVFLLTTKTASLSYSASLYCDLDFWLQAESLMHLEPMLCIFLILRITFLHCLFSIV